MKKSWKFVYFLTKQCVLSFNLTNFLTKKKWKILQKIRYFPLHFDVIFDQKSWNFVYILKKLCVTPFLTKKKKNNKIRVCLRYIWRILIFIIIFCWPCKDFLFCCKIHGVRLVFNKVHLAKIHSLPICWLTISVHIFCPSELNFGLKRNFKTWIGEKIQKIK